MPFTLLSPSRRERDVRRLACLLSLACAVVLFAGAWRSESFDWVLALAALATVGAGCAAGRMPRRERVEVGIDRDGRLVARAADSPDAQVRPLECVFAAPWLITARCGTTLISIWPDSVSGNAFRRYWVHIRWSRASAVGPPAAATTGECK